jgi:ABC-type dipeptide/oligopeptide/nickel transport system permease component
MGVYVGRAAMDVSLSNLAVDLAYAYLDPRIRYS